jgi:cysteine-rich repeat protein
MYTMRNRHGLILVLALAGAPSCAIVNTDHLDDLRDDGDTDAGMQMMQDAGREFDDTCGQDPPEFELVDTQMNIAVDTTGYLSDNSSACGAETPGADVFLGVRVQAGEFWHFHLAAMTPGLLPMLYLTRTCDARDCEYVSAACSGGQDEHFAFIADAPGLWYIGIDDSMTGGGRYSLSAYRPDCGNNEEEHGEGCDDGNATDGDGCDRRCRTELSETSTMEQEPNDNTVEANALRMPVSNVLDVTGNIGGPGACTYADVFAVSVPANGDVNVDALNTDGTACTSSALTPFRFALESSSRTIVESGSTDANGCAVVRATNLAEGTYFVRVEIITELGTAANYRMRTALLP